ncbi:MAG TPA: DnaJ domain-containing protein [Amnibacterium sp.]|jgi:hypothetical protein|nr:DnaJ domain-containing protein [Amnibacterium sp.]
MTRSEAAALLGVTADATGADVQRAFLRLARRVHPDVLPNASDPQRRQAAERFDALVRARGVLLEAAAAASQEDGSAAQARRGAPSPRVATDPRSRSVPARGLGDSLVVLALLAFLLVAIVTVDDALRTHAFESPSGGASPAATASP